jgi:drug/metabolite transporter (DMT)-like permease
LEAPLSGKIIIGIVLIVLGILGLVYQGFGYNTRHRIADVGPLHGERTEHHAVPLPPVLGAIALIGGIVVIASDRRAK